MKKIKKRNVLLSSASVVLLSGFCVSEGFASLHMSEDIPDATFGVTSPVVGSTVPVSSSDVVNTGTSSKTASTWSIYDYLPSFGSASSKQSDPQGKDKEKEQGESAYSPHAFLQTCLQEMQSFLGDNECIHTLHMLHDALVNGQVGDGVDLYAPMRHVYNTSVPLAGPSSSQQLLTHHDPVPSLEQANHLLSHPFVAPLFDAYVDAMAPKVENLIRNALVLGAQEGGAYLAEELGLTQKVVSIIFDSVGKDVTKKGAVAALGLVAPQLALGLELMEWFKLGFFSNLSASIISNVDGLVERLFQNGTDQLLSRLSMMLKPLAPGAEGAHGFIEDVRKYSELDLENEIFRAAGRGVGALTGNLLGAGVKILTQKAITVAGVEEGSWIADGVQFLGQAGAVMVAHVAGQTAEGQLNALREKLPEETKHLLDEIKKTQNSLNSLLKKLTEIMEVVNSPEMGKVTEDVIKRSIRTSLVSLQRDLKEAGCNAQSFVLFANKPNTISVGNVAHAMGTVNRTQNAVDQALWRQVREKTLAFVPASGNTLYGKSMGKINRYAGSVAGRLFAREVAAGLEGQIAPVIRSALVSAPQSHSTIGMGSLLREVLSFASPSIGQALADNSIDLMDAQVGDIGGYTLLDLTSGVLPQADGSSWAYVAYKGYAHTVNAWNWITSCCRGKDVKEHID